MNANIAKMSHRISEADATLLVEAGFRTPRQIKAATDETLLAVSGLGEATLARIRAQYPEEQ